jgi:hypothetical protein
VEARRALAAARGAADKNTRVTQESVLLGHSPAVGSKPGARLTPSERFANRDPRRGTAISDESKPYEQTSQLYDGEIYLYGRVIVWSSARFSPNNVLAVVDSCFERQFGLRRGSPAAL